jgi:hypothetical protein
MSYFHFQWNYPLENAIRVVSFPPHEVANLQLITTDDAGVAIATRVSELTASGLLSSATPGPSLHRFRQLTRERTAIEQERGNLIEKIEQLDEQRNCEELFDQPGFSETLARIDAEINQNKGQVAEADRRLVALRPFLETAREVVESDLARQAGSHASAAIIRLEAKESEQRFALLGGISKHLVELLALKEAIRHLRNKNVGSHMVRLLDDALDAAEEEQDHPPDGAEQAVEHAKGDSREEPGDHTVTSQSSVSQTTTCPPTAVVSG